MGGVSFPLMSTNYRKSSDRLRLSFFSFNAGDVAILLAKFYADKIHLPDKQCFIGLTAR